MKKVVAILCLFLFALFTSGQKNVNVTNKDTASLILKVFTEGKREVVANENFQLQLIKAVDNQSSASQSIANAVATFGKELSAFTKEIENKNKNDSELVTSMFGYNTEKVKKVIKIERWLNFSVVVLTIGALLWLLTGFSESNERFTSQRAILKLLWSLSIAFVFYVLTLKLLTLLFNGDYYVIKELITLYT